MDTTVSHNVIHITSFNCKNINNCGNKLFELFDSNDIVRLKETWLTSFECTSQQPIHARNYFHSPTRYGQWCF